MVRKNSLMMTILGLERILKIERIRRVALLCLWEGWKTYKAKVESAEWLKDLVVEYGFRLL